jgi:hypothetical protein
MSDQKGGIRIDPSVAELLLTEEGTAEFAEMMAVVTLQQVGMLAPAPWYYTKEELDEYKSLYEIVVERYKWTSAEFEEQNVYDFPDDKEFIRMIELNKIRLRRKELLERE